MFEGGQTPLYKLIPKRGFKNKHGEPMNPVNLGTLQDYVDMGRLPVDKELTIKDLVDAGVTRNVKQGVKLLAKGTLTAPLTLKVSRASSAAIEAIEQIGGEITTVHYNALALRALLKPQKFDIIPKFARPPPNLMPYYTNWNKNRGYLSPQAQLRELIKKRPELKMKQEEKETDE
jgi:large subunit ribosomal protein L15